MFKVNNKESKDYKRLLFAVTADIRHMKPKIIFIFRKSSWCFTKFFFRHKWNDVQLLLICMVYTCYVRLIACWFDIRLCNSNLTWETRELEPASAIIAASKANRLSTQSRRPGPRAPPVYLPPPHPIRPYLDSTFRHSQFLNFWA